MFKSEVLNRIGKVGVVAVVRAKNEDQAFKIATACINGGIPAIEVTFTVPDAEKVIYALSQKFSEDVLILGAGTVLDKQTAELAIEHGAKYIVSPGFDKETAEYCVSVGVPYLPGCMTLTEMLTARNSGSEIIKLFPGSHFGPSFIKSVKGPLPDINIMPTGGVDLNNVHEWIQNGCVAVGIGGQLTGPAATDNYEEITNLAKQFVEKVQKARK